jgi:hypothetical protein
MFSEILAGFDLRDFSGKARSLPNDYDDRRAKTMQSAPLGDAPDQ